MLWFANKKYNFVPWQYFCGLFSLLAEYIFHFEQYGIQKKKTCWKLRGCSCIWQVTAYLKNTELEEGVKPLVNIIEHIIPSRSPTSKTVQGGNMDAF